jgi:methyltransferase
MYYYLFILAVGLERLVELVFARRNAAWSIAQGGKEFGRDHYPAMVSMHALLLVSCVVEVWTLHRPFIGWLGWPMVGVVVLSTVVRWWCVAVLGKRWNPRLIVIPDAPLVRRGPYRWLHHPNYTAVVAEVAALPLVHSAWLTAIVFSMANALVLTVRIRAENAALGYA